MTTESTPVSRADIIQAIREMAAQGNGCRYIAEALNSQQVPTLSGRKGARWQHGTIANLAKQYGFRVAYRHSLASAFGQGCSPPSVTGAT